MQSKLTTLVLAAALSGIWLPATADSAARDKAAASSVVDAPPPNYSDSMARLQEAAQRLRESIQSMAQQPSGERRDAALEQAHKALFDAQQAMIQLPPEMYVTEGAESLPNYTVAMERLQQAAQKLRESVQAMAQAAAGKNADAAMRQAREAILETQQAMIYLPPRMRSQTGSDISQRHAASAHGDVGTRTMMISTTARARSDAGFDRLDCNRDGRISHAEWQNVHSGG